MNPTATPTATPMRRRTAAADAARSARPLTPEPRLSSRSANMVIARLVAALLVFCSTSSTCDGLWSIVKAALGPVASSSSSTSWATSSPPSGATSTSRPSASASARPFPAAASSGARRPTSSALFPLGGYVQMVGEVDGDEVERRQRGRPALVQEQDRSASAWLIISAGVIMNVILAVVCFIVVYQGPGKEHPAAVIELHRFRRRRLQARPAHRRGDHANRRRRQPDFHRSDAGRHQQSDRRKRSRCVTSVRARTRSSIEHRAAQGQGATPKPRRSAWRRRRKLQFAARRDAPEGPVLRRHPGRPTRPVRVSATSSSA